MAWLVPGRCWKGLALGETLQLAVIGDLRLADVSGDHSPQTSALS